MITVGLYGIADPAPGPRPNFTHDHGIALVRDGRVITVVQLERYTGLKYDNRLPDYICELLSRYLPAGEPVRFASVNSFAGSTFASRDGNLRIEPEEHVEVSDALAPAQVRWRPDGVSRRHADGWVVCHELAHLASLLPFVGRFEPGSLLAHIDGGASESACSFWTTDGERLRLLESSWPRLKTPVNNFNASPLVRAILGLSPADHLAMPGKLMGYAGHGAPDGATTRWLADHGWFSEYEGREAAILDAVNHHFGTRYGHFDLRLREFKTIAACIQASFEEEVTSAIAEAQRRTGAHTLYLAGGAALNIPTNARLERLFEQVHVPPCTNDSGLALGAAAWVEYLDRHELPIHGPFLNTFDVPTEPPTSADVARAARLLADGKIIGVCTGAAEIGPRALGHRSLLARADSAPLRRRLSEVIKRREWYRPVAPVLCEESARELLGEDVVRSPLSRYMLGAYPVRPGSKAPLSGVLHEDGTVRPQVVRADDEDNHLLHDLLSMLLHDHGVAALVNTSFNGAGRPIVHRRDEAAATARAMKLDALMVDGSLHRP